MALRSVELETGEIESTYYQHSCKYNDGVTCEPLKRPCSTCGWNPAVAKARLEKFCKKNGIPVPELKKEEET